MQCNRSNVLNQFSLNLIRIKRENWESEQGYLKIPVMEFCDGLFIRDELARLGGLAYLSEMIFIPRSHEIFYLTSIKKFISL